MTHTAHRTAYIRRQLLNLGLSIVLSFLTGAAIAAPSVRQVNGSLDHNGTITITGSGFGLKPSAAPIVWDNATGNSISDKWDGAWPDKLPGLQRPVLRSNARG